MHCRVEYQPNIPGEALPQTYFIWQNQDELQSEKHRRSIIRSIGASITTGLLLTGFVLAQDNIDTNKAQKDENGAFIVEVEGSEFKGESCPNSGLVDDVNLSDTESLIETTKSVELLSDYNEYLSVLDGIEYSIDDNQAFTQAFDYFRSKDIELLIENDVDGIGLERVTHEKPTKNQLINLIMAMNTIPKSLIQSSGIQEIRLSNNIFSAKSSNQIEIEIEKQTLSKEYNIWGGYFNSVEGGMGLSTEILEAPNSAIRAIWHELVGHGTASKLCDPGIDAEFYALAFNFLGEEVEYAPEWQQTNIQKIVHGSGKVTQDSYGGTNI